MAKLPPVGSQTNGNAAIDNLTKKVNEMRTTDPNRAPRQNNATGFTGRGRGRGGPRQEPRKIEVPKDDFDFESSNAKFNKQDLVKEAIAGSPLAEAAPEEAEDKLETIPGSASYNKKSSFFDDLSSEIKDRAEGKQGGARPGGREWRGEEQKKNVETFGQGSVDNGYRGGYRGRGRGRGGMRGRGYGNGQPGNRSRGGYRGPRDDSQAVAQ
jgi:protein LSM14